VAFDLSEISPTEKLSSSLPFLIEWAKLQHALKSTGDHQSQNAASKETCMFELIAGLFSGTVLSVVADRSGERVDKRLRLELTIDHFHNHKGEVGLSYLVRNVGSLQIPQFRIGLWHPSRGTMSAFYSEQSGPLLPDQTRAYNCSLFKNGIPAPFLKYWISHEKETFVTEPTFEHFKLIVKMENSDRVLLKSKKMGSALAKAWHRSMAQNSPPSLSLADQRAMSSPPRFGFENWLKRHRMRNDCS
jgi:hypothetical protein